MAEKDASSIGAPVYVIVPDESDEPVFHPGKMIESDAETFVAEFDCMQPLPPGFNVHVYTELGGKFYQQKAIVREIGRSDPNPVMKFERVGPQVSAEKRCSYRVRVVGVALTGRIGDEKRCGITDISPEGLAVIARKAWDLGSAVPIHIEYQGHILDGPARLQSVSELPDGKYRCGFLIPERNARMRRSLERISSTIQRFQLRNLVRFRALDSSAEVSGETIQAGINGIDHFRETALKIFAQYGIIDPQPGEWYRQQSWLDALSIIYERMGSDALYNIGLMIPGASTFPDGTDLLDKALNAMDMIFHMNHRNGEIGHYYFGVAGEKTYEVSCDSAYPCDFDRGVLSAVCELFMPRGSQHHAVVTHDNAKPCRKSGATSCTYRVIW